MKKIILLYSLICLHFFTIAQNQYGIPFIHIYTPKQYNAHYQNWSAIQTNENLMLFANGDGILSFDGKDWNLFDSKLDFVPRMIKKQKDENFYVSGNGKFGKLIIDSTNKLSFKTIYNFDVVIWDFYVDDSIIYLLSEKFIEVRKNNKIVYHKDTIIYNYTVDKNENKFFYNRRQIYFFKNRTTQPQVINFPERIVRMFQRNDSTFILSPNKSLYFIDEKLTPKLINQISFSFDNLYVQDVKYFNKKYIISSYNAGIYILNDTGGVINHLDVTNGLPTNTIYSFYIDKQQNLWCCSNAGIFYVDISSPIRIIDKRYDPTISNPGENDFIDGIIYTNTGYSQVTIEFINKEPVIKPFFNIQGQVWRTTKIGNELYLARNPRIMRVDNKGNTKAYGPLENIWDIIKIPNTKDNYIIGGSTGLFVYRYNGDSLVFVKKVPNFNKRARNFFFDSFNNLWIPNSTDGLYKLRLNSNFEIENQKIYGEKKGLTNFSSLKLFEWFNKLFISTYKTLYVYDYLKDSIYEYSPITDKFDHSGKKIIQLVGIDHKKNLWFEYHNEFNKVETFCLSYFNGQFIEIYKTARRLFENGISDITKLDDNSLFLSLTDYFAVFQFQEYSNIKIYKPQPLITKIYDLNNDTTLFWGTGYNSDSTLFFGSKTQMTFNFKHRNLRIYFALPDYIEPNGTLYRYKLLNHDNKWSQWTFENKKDYTNLPPGSYTFVIESKNIFGEISPKTNFTFIIKAPWYRSIYAYILYSLLMIGVFYLIIWLYTYSLRKRNIKLQMMVDDRTQELKQKNIELEQQKEEILTQAEELNIANQQLEKFSTIIRETDNAVILMDRDGNFVWINPAYTRIFGYNIDELVNNISPNIIGKNTTDEIKKLIDKCLFEKTTVKYELNLTNKFGKEIWIHTTLTPILDDENQITDLVAIDADITPIKEAQTALEQREQLIEANITYASTIQQSILPSKDEIDKYFDSFIIYKPKDIVSGDFYWISNLFKTIDNRLTHDHDDASFKVGNTIFFAVIDCTGHGVPGAFMSLIANHLMSEIINEKRIASPKEALIKLDFLLSKALKRQNENSFDGMTISLCRFDKVIEDEKENIKVIFAGSKQHITYYRFNTQSFYRIRGSARQIAFTINQDIEFVQHQFDLDIGDLLLMYTDGLKDLNNIERMSFGHSKIIGIVEQYINNSIDKIGIEIEKNSNQWLGDSYQRDDIAFLILKMK